MSSGANEGRGPRRWWPALGAVALGLGPLAAQAEQWTIDNSFGSRYETNDNVSLVPVSPGVMNTLSLFNTLLAARRSESATTRLNAAFNALDQSGPGERDRVDGQLGLTQTLTGPLNSLDLSLDYLHDFNNTVQTVDVTVGQGRRRAFTLSGSWSHSLSERWSVQTGLSANQTTYSEDLVGAEDFRTANVSAGVSRRLSDTDTLSLDASHSDYRNQVDDGRSRTDQISLGLSRALSERSSASLSLGYYRTTSQAVQSYLACPLAVAFCDAGLVAPIVVDQRVDTTSRGLQFSLSSSYQLDETSEFHFAAAHEQVPSGAGVVVGNDSVNARLSYGLSPLLSGSTEYAMSRSKYDGANGVVVQPVQQTFSTSLTRQLAPDLSLRAAYQFTHSKDASSGVGARSNSLSIYLTFDWPKLDVAR